MRPVSHCEDWSKSDHMLRIFRCRPSLAFRCPPKSQAEFLSSNSGLVPMAARLSSFAWTVGQTPNHVTATIKTFIALIATAFWKSEMEKDLDLNQINGPKSLCGNWWVGTFYRSSTQSNFIHRYTVVASLYFPYVCNVHYMLWFRRNAAVSDGCAARCFSSGVPCESPWCATIF